MDSLERLAGVSDGKLIQAHGSFDLAFCISCEKNLPIESYKGSLFPFSLQKEKGNVS